MAEVSLMKQARLKVSSVLNKDIGNFGKQFMMDGNMETCWNSDQGSPQWIAIAFNSPVFPKRLLVQFQGGFAAKQCQVEVGIESLKETETMDPIYPEDVNALQDFQISSVPVPIKFLRIVFPSSTDFFGRIIIYKLDILGVIAWFDGLCSYFFNGQ